jgi:hypothetical protein
MEIIATAYQGPCLEDALTFESQQEPRVFGVGGIIDRGEGDSPCPGGIARRNSLGVNPASAPKAEAQSKQQKTCGPGTDFHDMISKKVYLLKSTI